VTEIDSHQQEESPWKEPERQSRPRSRQRYWLIVVAGFIIVLDQLSKMSVEATLPPYQSWAPVPSVGSLFRISHVNNTGSAFGLFPEGSPIFALAAVLVSSIILIYNYRLAEAPLKLRLALGLQLGGALGNFIDRMRIGHVTDFLDFGPWPVFNVADTSVVAGALLLAWIFWQEDKKQRDSAGPPAENRPEIREFSDESGALDEWTAV